MQNTQAALLPYLLFLIILLWTVQPSTQGSDISRTYFLDSDFAGSNSNVSCTVKEFPCVNLYQIVESAQKELSGSGQKIDLFHMKIVVVNELKNCSATVFDFSKFVAIFKLTWMGETQFSLNCGELLNSDSRITWFDIRNAHLINSSKLFVKESMENLTIVNVIGSGLDIMDGVYKVIEMRHVVVQQFSLTSQLDDLLIYNSSITFDNVNLKGFNKVEIISSFVQRKTKPEQYNIALLFGHQFSVYNTTVAVPIRFEIVQSILFEKVAFIHTAAVMFNIYGSDSIQLLDSDLRRLHQQSLSGNATQVQQFIRNAVVFLIQRSKRMLIERVRHDIGSYSLIKATDNIPSIDQPFFLMKDSSFSDIYSSSLIQSNEVSTDIVYRIENSHFYKIGGNSGSVIQMANGRLLLENSTFSKNQASSNGGVLYFQDIGKVFFSAIGCNFLSNRAQKGGVIYISNSDYQGEIINSQCNGNVADFAGGCIYSQKLAVNNTFSGKNVASSYGSNVATDFTQLYIVQVVEGNSQNNKITLYPGQQVELSLFLVDRYGQTAGTLLQNNELQTSGENWFISYSIVTGGVDPNVIRLNFKAFDDSKNKQRKFKFKIGSLYSTDIAITFEKCPLGYMLSESGSAIECVYLSLEILVPVIVISIVSVLSVLITVIYFTIVIARKILKLRKHENAELDIENKFKDSTFVFEEDESKPLLPRISSSNDAKQSNTIPIYDLKIVKKIGEGAQGIVYLADWNFMQVAVKRLKTDADDEEFEREAILMKSLKHPSIVSCYGVSLSSNGKFMVVEYMEKGSLESLLYKARMGIEKMAFPIKIKILLGVCKGMAYLHSIKPNKVVHRDLKPGNILLDNSYNSKVCDFGLSKIVSSVSATMTTNIGTLLYMAPELLADDHQRSEFSTKIDVYSFGIIMWEILFVKTPFVDDEMKNMSSPLCIPLKVMNGERPIIPFTNDNELREWISNEISKKDNSEQLLPCLKDYISLMKQCWTKTPSERPEFVEIVNRLEEVRSLVSEQ